MSRSSQVVLRLALDYDPILFAPKKEGKMSTVTTIIRLGFCPILLSLPVVASTCESLASLKFPKTSITVAQSILAGAFVPPGGVPNTSALAIYKSLPAFCRVQGVMQPSSDSHIEFEVWLPTSEWNGKYLGIGNGGFV